MHDGKIIDDSPKMNPSLPEGNGQEAQNLIHDSIILQEHGIYSLLQAESENQVLIYIITLISIRLVIEKLYCISMSAQ